MAGGGKTSASLLPDGKIIVAGSQYDEVPFEKKSKRYKAVWLYRWKRC